MRTYMQYASYWDTTNVDYPFAIDRQPDLKYSKVQLIDHFYETPADAI